MGDMTWASPCCWTSPEERRRQCLGEARNRLALLGSLVLVGYLGQPGEMGKPCLDKPSGKIKDMAVCQNLVPLVNIKIAGKWMFIPLKMVLIGIDP